MAFRPEELTVRHSKKEQTTTSPFNEKAENVKTTIIPLVPVLAENDHIKTELPFKRSGNVSSYLFILYTHY